MKAKTLPEERDWNNFLCVPSILFTTNKRTFVYRCLTSTESYACEGASVQACMISDL